MAESKVVLRVLDCPLCFEDKCDIWQDYNIGLLELINGDLQPHELDLDYIIKEVKSWP